MRCIGKTVGWCPLYKIPLVRQDLGVRVEQVEVVRTRPIKRKGAYGLVAVVSVLVIRPDGLSCAGVGCGPAAALDDELAPDR